MRISLCTVVFGFEGSNEETTVIPSLICLLPLLSQSAPTRNEEVWGKAFTFDGVFGIDLTTVHEDGTQSLIIPIVVPAKIEINNFPSNASDIPSLNNKCAAN